MSPIGMLHIYCGDGKGKTTAAIGLAVRVAGYGVPVLFCQFLKGSPTGELAPMDKLGIRVLRPVFPAADKFVFQMTDAEKQTAADAHRHCFAQVCRAAADTGARLLVLDEVLDAVALGLLPLPDLLAFLEERPPGLDVVCTGRDPHEQLCALADYHTDFRALRHPYDRGISAREGIEY